MKHYHGTPIGGKSHKAEEFCEGRFLLIPWKRPDDLERAMEFSKGFIVDNSAFSFWNSGEKPDWSKYAVWVRNMANHPRFEFAFIPDEIDGDTKENNRLIDWWQRTMAGIPSCPVWHLHESMERLKWLCMNYERVAMGSSGQWANPGQSDGWWERMDEAFDTIADPSGYPIAKIHGLRMLRRDIIERYPFASCDSTNAVQNGTREAKKNGVDSAFGMHTIARRIEAAQSPSKWIRKEKQAVLPILN